MFVLLTTFSCALISISQTDYLETDQDVQIVNENSENVILSEVAPEIKYTYYDNGKVKTEVPYVDGVIHGLVKFYDNAGHLTEYPVVNGKRHGTAYIYNEDGQILSKVNFADNKIV